MMIAFELVASHLRGKLLKHCYLLIIALSACSGPGEFDAVAAPAANQGIPVRLASVQLRSDNELLRFSSISRVRQRAFLTFQVGGVIQSRTVELGDHVAAGQTLMTLYSPSLQPAAEAAQFRLEQLESDKIQADRELERLNTLYERGVIPLQELEQQATRSQALVSAVSNARATAQQAMSLLNEAELVAPFSGTVEQILLEPGEFAQPGQAVIRVSSSAQLEAEIRVPAHLTEGLSLGQSLSAWRSLASGMSDDATFTVTILEIGQSSTGDVSLYPVVVGLPEQHTRTGEALEVGVPRRNDAALIIPMSAVMRSADGLTVFQSVNNRVTRVAIEVEQLQGEFAVIRPGVLSEGAQVVYAGLTRLADGDLIEVLP
ncbi:MAG: efflux RND transporter periplasmic adaptor subunit [Pseudohongiella sp.]|nr:efflux RND transporter periplasmic adaptor subunit [Pseudohongiella sp.]